VCFSAADVFFSAGLRGLGEMGRAGVNDDSSVEIYTHKHSKISSQKHSVKSQMGESSKRSSSDLEADLVVDLLTPLLAAGSADHRHTLALGVDAISYELQPPLATQMLREERL